MDREIFLILQKFSVEVIILAILTSIICFFIKKYLGKKLKKILVYLPYLFGVLFYVIYSLFLPEKDFQKAFSMGITTGGLASIILSFIKTQGDKTTLAEEVLRGIISEKDMDIVTQKINDAQTEKEIADVICNYAVFSMTYDQCMVFAEIIAYSKKQE